ncbi:hypothetical protein Salat_1921000 [Sesamum alatum]|uniref:Uncharacterized protein n=1 Tax=Sesamum alatum TaxID=300844 RepID=A0AAE1Y4M7_9LAMI|nr:hypothetical protein Salat_1921000 [Sesamum alatum]
MKANKGVEGDAVRGGEGDTVRGAEGEGGEAMRGGEGEMADAMRCGEGNREDEVIEDDGCSDSTKFDDNDIDLENDVEGEKLVDDDAENRREVVMTVSSDSEFVSDEDMVGSQPPTQGMQSQDINFMEQQESQPLRHIFSQCSNVNEASGSESQVPFLTKGGKIFITMTNLSAAIHASKKKKPNT